MSRTSSFADERSSTNGDTSAQWEPESPFVDRLVVGETASPDRSHAPSTQAFSPYSTESPFLSLYETGGDADCPSPQARELYGILAELRDAEFDTAVYQLQAEAYDLLAPRLEGEEEPSDYEVEQFFSAHFAPLVRETGRMLDSMAAEVERRDVQAMTEPEIEGLLARFEPDDTGLTPSFEGFLKKVFDKAKKAVKKVASAVKKGVVKVVKTVGKIAGAPIAIVLKKLKALVKPLLEKVLKSAIGKLPEPLQDAAKQAAQKLFGDKAKTSDVESELSDFEASTLRDGGVGDSTDDELGHLQTEFDLQIANLILADDETRQDVAIADYETRARRHGVAPYRRLRRARRRFVGNLQKLDDGDDPAPAVEQFIPAILPVLKLGLKIIGRKRVVEAIGKLVGNLLRPFTGPKMAVPLANAIVDTGLRIIGFEMTEDNKATMAAEATAAVVEDTVRQVAQIPPDVLDNEIFLEALVEEAFDAALARNFPPMPRRPDLIRSELPGGWPNLGLEYKRFVPTTPIQVTISQRMASELKTFGGTMPTVLGHSLQELVGKRATVWIYEAVPGTWLSKISRDEKVPHGLNGVEEYKWRSIHPLTREAAVLLADDASMAGTKAIDAKYLQSPHLITPEQRFYYLEIPGLEPKTGTSHHESAFYFILDCSQRFGSMTFYLSEQDAQMIAKHLRAGNKTLAEKELAKIWWRVAVEAVGQRFKETVDIRKEAIEIDHILPLILRPIITKGLQWLVRALGPIVVKMIVDRLFKEFIKYADDPQDGVTFKLLWRTVAGIDVICRYLNSQNVSAEDFRKAFTDFMANHVNNLPVPEIRAGYHRD